MQPHTEHRRSSQDRFALLPTERQGGPRGQGAGEGTVVSEAGPRGGREKGTTEEIDKNISQPTFKNNNVSHSQT